MYHAEAKLTAIHDSIKVGGHKHYRRTKCTQHTGYWVLLRGDQQGGCSLGMDPQQFQPLPCYPCIMVGGTRE